MEPAFHQFLSEILSTVVRTHFMSTEMWHTNVGHTSMFPYVSADSDADIELPDLHFSSSDSDKS